MQFSVSLDAPATQWPVHFSPALKCAGDIAVKGIFDTNLERLKRRCEEARADAVTQLERDVREVVRLITAEDSPAAAPVAAEAALAKVRRVITRRSGGYSVPQLVEHLLTMPEPFTVRQLFTTAPAGLGTMLFFSQLTSQLLAKGFLFKTGQTQGKGKRKAMLLKRTGKPYPFTREQA